MKNNDLISVIIPYHRKKKFFQETIDSICKQTYKNYEVIVIYDDICLDELDFVKNILRKIKIKKLIINNKNYGAGISRNKGILKAKGKYIAFCDADDVWEKNKLDEQLKFMLKNNLEISYTNYFIINEQSRIIGNFKTLNRFNYHELLKSCDIGLSTIILKKKFFNKNKFSNLRTKEDYLLWLKIAKKIKFIHGLSQYLSSWRANKNSLSSSVIQKLLDAFRLYRFNLNYSFIYSLFLTARLTFYAIIKKIKISINYN